MNDKKSGMTYSEIGSFFWLGDAKRNESERKGIREWLPDAADEAYTFSGRSSIDLALQDIIATRGAKSAYLPAYLCDSMVQPFKDHNIDIHYYKVWFQNGRFVYEYETDHGCDIVLIMSYFGLDTKNELDAIRELKKNGAIIIEDLTHSLLCKEAYSAHSDYYVCALRKCLEIPTGGWVGKKDGTLHIKPYKESDPLVETKIRGMYEKYDYITGKTDTKQVFWDDQSQLEEYLDRVDHMLKIDSTSLGLLNSMDVCSIAAKRKKNAEVLWNALKDLDGSVLQLPELDLAGDVPLFIPVFLENALRNSLRKYLIENSVYCPVHWPEVVGAPVSVAGEELSLICDQRYGESDMMVIASLVHAWAHDTAPRI